MSKKQSVSSVPAKHRGKSAKHISDSEINFDDVPELSDKELTRGRRVGRPKSDHAKQLIAIRIDPRLLKKLKKLATKRKKPYQTLMHELLQSGVDDEAA